MKLQLINKTIAFQASLNTCKAKTWLLRH